MAPAWNGFPEARSHTEYSECDSASRWLENLRQRLRNSTGVARESHRLRAESTGGARESRSVSGRYDLQAVVERIITDRSSGEEVVVSQRCSQDGEAISSRSVWQALETESGDYSQLQVGSHAGGGSSVAKRKGMWRGHPGR